MQFEFLIDLEEGKFDEGLDWKNDLRKERTNSSILESIDEARLIVPTTGDNIVTGGGKKTFYRSFFPDTGLDKSELLRNAEPISISILGGEIANSLHDLLEKLRSVSG